MRNPALVLALAACSALPSLASAQPVFEERDGYVVMEVESVPIPSGHEWVQERELSGATGGAYYRFGGNSICSGPARSPLRYRFRITTEATYRLHLRAAKILHCVMGHPEASGACSESDRTCTSLGRPTGGRCASSDQCVRSDISNDAFVHIEDASGRYIPFDGQPARTFDAGAGTGEPVKLYGGSPDAWAFTGTRSLDIAGAKYDAHWSLPPGEYELVLEGRSRDFRIDRIVFFDTERGEIRGADALAETRASAMPSESDAGTMMSEPDAGAIMPGVDAGTPLAPADAEPPTTSDAGRAADGGSRPDLMMSGGCAVGGPSAPPAGLVIAALGVLMALRRRRRG